MSRTVFTPYAAPLPKVLYSTVLKPVQAPLGCYPIEIVQFWRGERAPGCPRPLHWTIVVRTSAHRGNTYELVGDTRAYAPRYRLNVPLATIDLHDDWRGSAVVGFVGPNRMGDLVRQIMHTEVVHRERWWDGQNWVQDALWGWRAHDLYTDANASLAALQTHFCCLLEAWELGDL